MSPGAGTVAQLSAACKIPERTIRLYIADGDLTPVGHAGTGRRRAAVYSRRQLMAVWAQRHRRHGAAELRLAKEVLGLTTRTPAA